MTGKTHMMVGITASLAATVPHTPKEMLICIAAGAVGGVISDIDVSTSEARKDFNKLLGIAFLILTAALGLEYHFRFGIYHSIKDGGYWEVMAGLGLFFCVCIFGKTKPHRSFMHSFLALFLLSVSVYLMASTAAVSFAAAMLSHILLDLLNKKKVRIFYPFGRGNAFSFCRADGIVNGFLFYGAFAAALMMIGRILFAG